MRFKLRVHEHFLKLHLSGVIVFLSELLPCFTHIARGSWYVLESEVEFYYSTNSWLLITIVWSQVIFDLAISPSVA